MPDFTRSDEKSIAEFARAFKGPSTQERPFALPLTESEIQRAVFMHLRTRGAPNSFAFHPKNGARPRGGLPSAQGVIAGVPDIVILTPGQCYALELKTETGRLSTDQKKVLVDMGHCGAITGVAYGLDDALSWLERHDLLKRSA